MTELLLLGEYNGNRIRVNPADRDYVNATDMAKACGKEWSNYRQLKQTDEFLAELESVLGIPRSDLIMSVSGGDPKQQGTWIHRQIAIHFAQWLSPSFSVWCGQQLEKLMRTGRVVLHQEHQEAELSHVVRELRDAVLQCKESNIVATEAIRQTRAAAEFGMELVKQLQRSSPERLESAVEWQLHHLEGGIRQVKVTQHMIVDLLTNQYVIEIKHHKDWKSALGQVKLYGDFLPNHKMRIHLFAKPLARLPSAKARAEIEHACHRQGVAVTWHTWEHELFKRKDVQRLLEGF